MSRPDTKGTGLGARMRQRWFPTESEIDAVFERERTAKDGATPVSEAVRGVSIRVSGSLRSVCLCASGTAPRLEAELYDGTGRLTLVWMGRRRIPGINAGRSIVVSGRITDVHGQPTMFNPRYELRAGSSS